MENELIATEKKWWADGDSWLSTGDKLPPILVSGIDAMAAANYYVRHTEFGDDDQRIFVTVWHGTVDQKIKLDVQTVAVDLIK